MWLFKRPIWAIILGGVFFLLPLLAIIVLVTRGVKLVLPLGHGIAQFFSIETLFGAATIGILSVIILLLIAYISGLLVSRGFLRTWSSSVEEKLFLMFPNFQMIKYQLIKDADKFIDRHWDAVLLEQDGSFKIAFLTDTKDPDDEIVTFFIPDAPRIDAGEVCYMLKTECTYHSIPMKTAMDALSHFGRHKSIVNLVKQIKKEA